MRSRLRGCLDLSLLLACAWLPSGDGSADEITAGVYVRSDTDGTVVLSPSAAARVGVVDDATWVEAGYAADIWTSASIDIRTAATREVSEQRDELTLGVEREQTDVTLRADYRFSHETDYVSHGGSLSISQRLAEGNATIGTVLFAAQDTVGRSGDQDFSRALSTVGARASYTQVLDPNTLTQFTYELARREGFQSSPYRFVGVGGDGSCAGTATLCLPETHPGVRLRNTFVARVRRGFGRHASGGLAYRFYLDDWEVQSHTAIAQLSYLPDESSTLGLRYRFYLQSEASFYEARYTDTARRLRFVTRDRELSPLRTNRLSLSYERSFDLTDAGPLLELSLAVSATTLAYQDFVGLDRVWAFDAILHATVEL